MFVPSGTLFGTCLSFIIAWAILITYLGAKLYINTIQGIDQRRYDDVKKWTIIGMVVGFLFAGGIISFIIYLVSLISIDEAIRIEYYGYSYPPYPPYSAYPPPYYYPPPYPHPVKHDQHSRDPYHRKKRRSKQEKPMKDDDEDYDELIIY
jgi:hypothetical protein